MVTAHSDALLAYLSENLADFVSKANTLDTMKAVLKSGAIKDQEGLSDQVVKSIFGRLFEKHSRTGFTRTDVNALISSDHRRILTLNGPEHGAPVAQVMSILLNRQMITFAGQEDPANVGKRGMRFYFCPTEGDPNAAEIWAWIAERQSRDAEELGLDAPTSPPGAAAPTQAEKEAYVKRIAAQAGVPNFGEEGNPAPDPAGGCVF